MTQFTGKHPLNPSPMQSEHAPPERPSPSAGLPRHGEREVPLDPALAARIRALGDEALARAARGAAARTRWLSRGGWLLAAAVLLAWGATARVPRRREATVVPADQAAQALLDSLLGDPATVRTPWAESADPFATGARGEVVWHAPSQRGVMRIAGLRPNDPAAGQYQLWIFDAERDERYPVDGGVFDVSTTGEVLVPVASHVPVRRATLFAITYERPGGVVVSARERLVLAGSIAG